MILESLSVGPFQCNCTILGCEKTREAVVIDPGEEAERIITLLQERGLKPKYLLHTHAHLDHVGGTCGVQEKVGGEACLHEADKFLFDNVAMQAALFNLPPPRTGKIDQWLLDGDQVDFGEHRIEVWHTPGHTPGSLSFYLPDPSGNRLFTGDTLFASSIGRTDLWGGNYEQILRSIRDKILPCDDDTVVYAGHGPNSTVGAERRHNPFLQNLS